MKKRRIQEVANFFGVPMEWTGREFMFRIGEYTLTDSIKSFIDNPDTNYVVEFEPENEGMMEKSKRETGGIEKFIEEEMDRRLNQIIESMSEKIDELQAKANAYNRLMSGDKKGWMRVEDEPEYTGYYMVIANVASEFGGYRGVIPAHYNTHAKHWSLGFGLIGSVIAYKTFPEMPDGWEEK